MKINMLLGALALGLGLTSCLDFGPQPDLCENGDCDYAYYEDAFIRVWYSDLVGPDNQLISGTEVESGSRRVFELLYEYKDDPNTQDDELWEYLRFSVPMDADEFTLDSETELEEAKAYFSRRCYCADLRAFLVEGTLTGTRKSSNAFEVSADLQYTDGYGVTEYIVFTRTFRVAELPEG